MLLVNNNKQNSITNINDTNLKNIYHVLYNLEYELIKTILNKDLTNINTYINQTKLLNELIKNSLDSKLSSLVNNIKNSLLDLIDICCNSSSYDSSESCYILLNKINNTLYNFNNIIYNVINYNVSIFNIYYVYEEYKLISKEMDKYKNCINDSIITNEPLIKIIENRFNLLFKLNVEDCSNITSSINDMHIPSIDELNIYYKCIDDYDKDFISVLALFVKNKKILNVKIISLLLHYNRMEVYFNNKVEDCKLSNIVYNNYLINNNLMKIYNIVINHINIKKYILKSILKLKSKYNTFITKRQFKIKNKIMINNNTLENIIKEYNIYLHNQLIYSNEFNSLVKNSINNKLIDPRNWRENYVFNLIKKSLN